MTLINFHHLGKHIANELLSEAEEESFQPGICFYPGAFKPPHKGHLKAAQYLASLPYVKAVKILISAKEREGITAQESLTIWKEFLDAEKRPNITVEIAKADSPIKDIMEYATLHPKEIIYVSGSPEEADDPNYLQALVDRFEDRIKPVSVIETVGDVDAETVRKILSDRNYDKFKKTLPTGVVQKGKAEYIYNLLVKEPPTEPVQENVTETVQNAEVPKAIEDFVEWCCKMLDITNPPKIYLDNTLDFVEQNSSFGGYSPQDKTITLSIYNRHPADIMRTLAHELVHARQDEVTGLSLEDGATGSDIENEANAVAGMALRAYGKINPSIYETKIPESIYEGRQVGVLYYFGPYRRLARLISNGFKLSSTIQPFVSFTRNKSMVSDTISNETRIAIDGDKLSNRYKITPFAQTSAGYGRSSADEAEERIDLSKYPDGIDISKVILGIDIKNPIAVGSKFDDEESFEPPSVEEYDKLLKILKVKNISYNIVEEFK